MLGTRTRNNSFGSLLLLGATAQNTSAGLSDEGAGLRKPPTDTTEESANAPAPADDKADSSALHTMRDELDALKQTVEAQQAVIAELQTQERIDATAPIEEVDPNTTGLKNAISGLPLEFFVFGDFYYSVIQNAPDDFALGQLELDVAVPLVEYLGVSAAVAYDGQGFGVGAFTIDGRIAGSEAGYLHKTEKVKSLGLLLGKFDVPLGIAYLEYASMDHRFVTMPIAVDHTHDAWNDLGVQFYLDTGWANLVLFATNGFNYDKPAVDPDGEPVLDEAGVPLFDEAGVVMAAGARVGLHPFEPFEIGGSVAGQFTDLSEVDMVLTGADLQLALAGMTLKAEYLSKTSGTAGGVREHTRGFYGQGMYDFVPVYLIARYGEVYPDDGETLRQLSGGIGVAVVENAEIRFEYTTNLETGGNVFFIQLAGGLGFQPTGFRR